MEEKITLTLDQEETKVEPVIEEEKTEETSQEKAYKFDESTLSAEEKKMVEDFSKQIDITSSNVVLQYGA